MGVEDFQQQDLDRDISAVRNVYAGVLLLARLRELVADDTAISDLMATLSNALRRKPEANVLGDLLAKISVEISQKKQADTENLRANDHEIEGTKRTI